ncbi:restriction endonuclease subunit S [Cycloclasticus zancles]|uniref:Type I restriction enzyme, S subunit n=1 Tax=Cycloclasticus zancles 78-ME TaxID=1198232 RepID=S5TW10_9GAMM|nr:restriction endonuclease subunit S [Cycloclasticus zancles]AGS39320.1 Type I restriction enzyme, S subunit [Cycloclasticus zancles 78-ME]
MSSNWPIVTVDDIKADEKGSIAIGPFGSRMKSDCYVDKGIPVIRGTNITGGPTFKGDFVYITKEKADSLGSSNVYKNDLVFPHRGSIGEVGIILEDKRYVLSSSLMKLTCDMNKVNPVFLYYFFKSRIGRHELLKNASQVGTPGIGQPLTSLKGIEFRLPPLDKQNEIGDILSSLDKKIQSNTQTNQTLEQIAQAIFKSWFVDFDPVKAKIEALAAGGSADDAELAAMGVISAKTLDELHGLKASNSEAFNKLAQTAALFPAAMQDSELGEIPEGWSYCTFGDISACFDSKRVPLSKRKREEKQPGTIPYYGATSVMDYVNEWIFDDTYLLLGEDGSVVKDDGTPFVQYIWGKSWVNNHAHVLQGNNGVSTEHLMVFIKGTNIASYVTGAVQLKLNQKNMNSIPFLKASTEINLVFQGVLNGLYDAYKNNIESSQSLSSLRDSLLPRLLSGEMELKDKE